VSRLFVRFYLDEDVDVRLAPMVRAHGVDALCVRDAGKIGRTDEEQLIYAIAEGRAIVTHNRGDFAALAERYRAEERHHHGIVIAAQLPRRALARRLVDLVSRLTADEMDDVVLHL
jgi:hypothetical protein